MSAFALIMLLLALFGFCALIYYAGVCIPVILEDKKKVAPRNPELEVLVPAEGIPVKVNGVPLEETPAVKTSSNNPYPNAEDLDLDAEMIDPVQGRLTLDEPDASNTLEEIVVVPPTKKVRHGPAASKSEIQPLLNGEEDDGLKVNSKKPVIVAAVAAAAVKKKSKKSDENGIAEPQTVPLEKNIQSEHPVSHAVVSVPQVMSASMPVYDETSEEPTCTSIHEQHLLATLKAGEKNKTDNDDVSNEEIGWVENVKPENGNLKHEDKAASSASLSNNSDSDSSEAEVTSYSFTKDEEDVPDSTPEETNNSVTMLRFKSIDESGNTSKEIEDATTNCRQSPDGLSVKSLETEGAEEIKGEVIGSQADTAKVA